MANDIEDKGRWMMTINGVFSVKSMFRELKSSLSVSFSHGILCGSLMCNQKLASSLRKLHEKRS